jgi:signal transduction protein with GAF and PtsI domain
MDSKQEYLHSEINAAIQSLCENVKAECKADFVGVAFQTGKRKKICWHYAAGNRNEKFRRMEVRYGKGMAGRVIATGRPVFIPSFPHDLHGKAVDYPIMLAEQLVCARAVPVYASGIPKGVLLIGRRTSQLFSARENEVVQKAAENLERLLQDNLFSDLRGV